MNPLVPDFILLRDAAGEHGGRFAGAALSVDISGFTALTERLAVHGREGAEILAETLRNRFDPLIAAVVAEGGFISGFSGDGFVALFPEKPGRPAAIRADTAAQAMIAEFRARPVVHSRLGDHPLGLRVGTAVREIEWRIYRGPDASGWYFCGPAIAAATAAQQNVAIGNWRHATDAPLPDEMSSARLPPSSVPNPSIAAKNAASFIAESVREFPQEGEFRDLTAVFAGFETVPDPEALAISLAEAAARHGGHCCGLDFGDKGWSALLLFGAPLAREGDSSHALDCAVELAAGLAGAAARCGVTRGIAYAGFNGGRARHDFTALGPGINLAARLMSAAGSQEILCDSAAHAAARGLRAFEAVAGLMLKGIAEPVSAWRLSHRVQVGRKNITALAGRQAERAALSAALAPLWTGANGGEIVLTGEPGSGKTLLLEHLRAALDGSKQEITWLECPSDDMHRDSLRPLAAALSGWAGTPSDASPEARAEVLARALADLSGRLPAGADSDRAALSRAARVLPAVFGAELDSDFTALEARLRHDNLLQSLAVWVRALTAVGAVIFAVEDAHWLDPDSRTALAAILRACRDRPLALIYTQRPMPSGLATSGTPALILHLGGLNAGAMQTLAERQLGGPASPALLRWLAARTDGNAFFASQLLAELSARNELRASPDGFTAPAETALPGGVNAMLVARLDRLSAPVKRTVQMAAVLGREFSLAELAAMQDDPAEGATIAAAAAAGIWNAPARGYCRFSHALLRDAAYDMQARARLRELHGRAMASIESLHRANLAPHHATLALHAERAEDAARARHHLAAAAGAAREGWRLAETLDFAERWLRLLPVSGEETVRARMLAAEACDRLSRWADGLVHYEAAECAGGDALRLLAQRAELHRFLGRTAEAWALLERCLADARKAGQTQLAAECLNQLGNLAYDGGDLEAGRRLREEALALFRGLGDQNGEAWCLSNLGVIARDLGHLEAAVRAYDECLALRRAMGDRFGEATVLNNLGVARADGGEFAAARAAYARSLALRRDIGDRFGEASCLNNIGELSGLYQGNPSAARRLIERAIGIFRDLGNAYGEGFGLWSLGQVELEAGEYSVALRRIEAAETVLAKINVHLPEIAFNHAETLLRLGRLNEAAAAHAAAMSDSADSGNAHAEGFGHFVAGLLCRFRGDADGAAEAWNRAETTAQRAKLARLLSLIARERAKSIPQSV